jgi:glutathione S-transferase
LKLFHAPTSPFARKVMACAVARGIEGRITLVPATGEGADLAAANPLGKLPCLVTDDGVALYDSRVICEFLDTEGNVFPMFPEHGMRFRALRFQALGDGVSDAAVLRRGEQGRPSEAARDRVIEAQKGKIARSLDALESDPPAQHVDIGIIAVACALGYLDLRFPAEPWREGRPKLTAWYEAVLQHPCLAQTKPD